MNLFIIPAYGDTLRNYKEITYAAKKKGYKVKSLNLQIKQGKLLSELVNIAVDELKKDKNSTVFGFSMGALIAYCASAEVPFKKAILCSVSSYLDKDILKLGKRFEKHLGKKLTADMKNMKYKKPKAHRTVLFYGELEHPVLVSRSKFIGKQIKDAGKLIMIKNTGHQLTPQYIKAVIKEL